MLNDVTISLDLNQLLGGDIDTRRTRVYVNTNVTNNTLIDTSTGETRLGDERVSLDADGTGSFTTWGVGADGNPTSWQTYVVVEYPRAGSRDRVTRTFGPYTITDADDGKTLAELEDEQAIPPNYQTAFTADMEAIRDEAEAARDAAVDISEIDTSDGVVSTLIEGTGGAGPLTRSALSASLGEQQGDDASPLAVATDGRVRSAAVLRTMATNGAAFGRSIPNLKKADGSTDTTFQIRRIVGITPPRTGATLGVMYGTDETNGPVRRSIDAGETWPYGSSNTRPPGAGVTQVVDYVYWAATDRIYSYNASDGKVYSTTVSVNGTDTTWTEETGLTLSGNASIFGQGLAASAWVSGDQYLYAIEYSNPGAVTGGPSIWRRPSTGGTSQAWTRVHGPLATFRHGHCIACDPYNPGHVYATLGDGLANQILRSTDYGATWESLTTDPVIQACQISFDANYVWFAADAGGPLAFVMDRDDDVIRQATFGSHTTVASPTGPVVRAITNKALTSNVATLTTSTAHGLTIGTNPLFPVYVTVVGVDSTFDGTYVVASAPTTTTFTYAKTAANVASAAATGQAQIRNPFRKQAYLGAVDPDTGIYYGMPTQDDNAPAKTGLFMVPEPGGPMFLIDGNTEDGTLAPTAADGTNEPNNTPVKIANDYVYFGRRRIKRVTR